MYKFKPESLRSQNKSQADKQWNETVDLSSV